MRQETFRLTSEHFGWIVSITILQSARLGGSTVGIALRETMTAIEQATTGSSTGRIGSEAVGSNRAVDGSMVGRSSACRVSTGTDTRKRGVARRARASGLVVEPDAVRTLSHHTADGSVTHARLAGGEHEALVRDVAERPGVVEAKDGLGDEVEDAVEDHLTERGDDVAAVGDTPGDRVEEPDEDEEGSCENEEDKDGRKEEREGEGYEPEPV
jgi:hypothetical protein